METITRSTRGLHLLWDLNWDRILYIASIGFALFLGGWIGSILS